MDATSIAASAIGAAITIAISALVDPVTRAYERRTKRIQHWRTVMDSTSSVGAPVGDDLDWAKELLQQELTEVATKQRG